MATLWSIGAVAERVGVHPQTLREYERQGLVTPRRTAGGTRRYGVEEIARLEAIQRLTAEGMSLAAVRYVLDLEDRLARAELLVAQLRQRLGEPAQAPRGATAAGTTVARRSISVELVHVPRPPRSPRWRNQD